MTTEEVDGTYATGNVISCSCIFSADITVCSTLCSQDFSVTYVVKRGRAHLRRHLLCAVAFVSSDRQCFKRGFVQIFFFFERVHVSLQDSTLNTVVNYLDLNKSLNNAYGTNSHKVGGIRWSISPTTVYITDTTKLPTFFEKKKRKKQYVRQDF